MTTILLVEDAADLAQVIIRELTEADYQVYHAADGLAALQLYTKHKPDLMILDWMLPGVSGIEICRRLKASATTREIPIIMISGIILPHELCSLLKSGVDRFLPKPLDKDLLRRYVDMLLSNRAAAAGWRNAG